ncbi:MAG: DUF2298 domain-containing protein [Chloroflexi bacterium]|nr:DUF2298 domain-containing protein [Chloroflexota bacterium]
MTLVIDWLSREGHYLLGWWLWIALAGAAVLPLCWRLLGGLPDRGYTLARAIGLLLVASLYWLLGSYGFLDNSAGSLVLCWLLILAGASLLCWMLPGGFCIREWWRENRTLVVTSELIFAALFIAWALFRAFQPELYTTEKPMELAFISASQRSPSFPPADPWMSGYAISYYYLGYVMSAALSLLSGLSSTVAFTLTNAMLIALTGACGFGVVYNLVRSRGRYAAVPGSAMIAAGMAVVMLTLMGNFQFLLIEAPYQSRAAPSEYFQFWAVNERADLPGSAAHAADSSLNLDTSAWSNWWWFRASRVLSDYNLDGNLTAIQPIDEFPAFSFLLADNHPHVLALPFVISAIGLMLNLLLLRRPPTGWETVLYGLSLGGLAFLNAWDAPIYLCGMVGVEALRRLMTGERGRLEGYDWLGLVGFAVKLTWIALLAYLPYFLGFRSQAGGILPNLVNPTYFPRFFIMFGPFVLILMAYLLVEFWRGRATPRFNWRLGWQVGASVLGISAGLLALAALAQARVYPQQLFPGIGSESAQTGSEWLVMFLERRLSHSLVSILLLLGMALVVARLFPARHNPLRDEFVAIRWITYPPATGFALLLIAMGLALAFFVEFFYLRDNFGVRINTVFKLYYQVWALWSIACAYALFSMIGERQQPRPQALLRLGLVGMAAASVIAGTAYTIAGVSHRAWIETGRQQAQVSARYAAPPDWDDSIRHIAAGQEVLSGSQLFSRADRQEDDSADSVISLHDGILLLDGDAVIVQKPLSLHGDLGGLSRDDQAVIACLSELVGRGAAVVAEAVQNAYDIQYGRVGTLVGIPNVLGWENHERQWRGDTYTAIAGTRHDDLRKLYTAADFASVEDIIARQGITHILYGQTERSQYGSLGEETLQAQLPVVCESGQSRVYAMRHHE